MRTNFCEKAPKDNGYYRVFSNKNDEDGQLVFIFCVSRALDNVSDYALHFNDKIILLRVTSEEQFIREDDQWIKSDYSWLDLGMNKSNSSIQTPSVIINKVSGNFLEIIEPIGSKDIEKTLINRNSIVMVNCSPKPNFNGDYIINIRILSGKIKNLTARNEDSAIQIYEYLKSFL